MPRSFLSPGNVTLRDQQVINREILKKSLSLLVGISPKVAKKIGRRVGKLKEKFGSVMTEKERKRGTIPKEKKMKGQYYSKSEGFGKM